MKLRIPKYSFLEILILIIVALDSNMFYLFPSSGILAQLNSPFNKYLILILIFAALLVVSPSISRCFGRNKMYLYAIAYMSVAIVCTSIFSITQYGESPFDVFTCWYHYYLVLLVIPLFYEMKCKNREEFIYNLIITCSIVLCLVSITQGVLYNATGKMIFQGMTSDMMAVRNGRLRLSTCSVNNLAIVILLSNLFNMECKKRQKIKYVIYLCIELFACYYIYMSRSYLIIYAGVAAVIFLSTTKSKQIGRLLTLVIVCIFAMNFLNLNSFVDSFSATTKEGTALSTVNRLGAIEYFSGVIANNPVFGMAYIRNSITSLSNILHGQTGTYYVSDLGLFGLIAESGMIGAGIFIFFTLSIISSILQLRKRKLQVSERDYSLACGFLGLWVLTSINVIVTDPRNSLSMPFVLAIVYYIADKCKMKNSSNCEERMLCSPH